MAHSLVFLLGEKFSPITIYHHLSPMDSIADPVTRSLPWLSPDFPFGDIPRHMDQFDLPPLRRGPSHQRWRDGATHAAARRAGEGGEAAGHDLGADGKITINDGKIWENPGISNGQISKNEELPWKIASFLVNHL